MGENVIELNGKRYDAITGAYLGKSNVVPKHIADQYIRGKVVDGFVRRSRPAAQPNPQPAEPARKQTAPASKPASAQVKPAAHPTAKTTKRAQPIPAHAKHHRAERSKTLMRRAAKKPEFSLKPAIKTQAPAEIMAKPASAIAHKRSAYGVDPTRKERAGRVGQHHAVRHFGTAPMHRVSAEVPVIAVRPVPAKATAAAPRPKTAHHTPQTHPHHQIFEKAIASASSHLEPAHKPRKHRTKRRKLANALAVVAAFLVIGSFVTYLNLPQLELRVASVQAGFGASMPAYTPTGYALENGVQRNGGTIVLGFRSGNQSFRITQQSSNWNSQTLLDNTLALNGEHQTIQKNGQIIYIYENGGTNAAWVNGGIRYDLTGNAQLSKDEIISIATSM